MQLPATAPVGAGQHPAAYLITMGPGDEPWEKFGHNMLWIHDPQRDADKAFNWGVFDFGEGFGGRVEYIYNFIQGRLWYWMVGFDIDPAIDSYLQDDRTVWVQELNLSPGQIKALLDYCQWFGQPKNREYRYDYFVDNCSTRVRDALDSAALAGRIRRRATTMPSQLTYRSETNRLMAGDLVLYTSIYFILGQPIDRKLSAWDEMYIPMRMRDRFNEMTITDELGSEVKLVKNEIILNTSKRPALRTASPNWVGWFLAVGVLIGTGLAACAFSMAQAAGWRHPARWGFLLLGICWSFLAGFAGWFLIYGWTLTDHIWVRRNENILQLSPLLFPLVVLVPLVLRRRKQALQIALALAVAALGASVLGLLLKVLPLMYQDNWNMIALALPANAGLAWALWKLNETVKVTSTKERSV
jgi:hypothetical protein